MVRDGPATAREAERALAIGYAPADARAGLRALLDLDALLGAVVRGTRTPVAGQLKLAWWRGALVTLDVAPAPGHPVLAALAQEVTPRVPGTELARAAEGWEALLDEPANLALHAESRGALLFGAGARLCGAPDDQAVRAAGRGWALADVATHWSAAETVGLARTQAEAALGGAFARRWPTSIRALGALALLARADLAGGVPGAPRRIGRVAWHRLTGG